MDIEYFRTIKYYIDSVVANEYSDITSLSCVIKGCPLLYSQAFTEKKHSVTLSKSQSILPVDSKSLTTLSFGICYFLAKSKWKHAKELIEPLLSLLDSTITPQVFNFIQSKSQPKDTILTERMVWGNFIIIASTLYSFAATLSQDDPFAESISNSLTMFLLRIMKILFRCLALNSNVVGKTHCMHDENIHDNQKGEAYIVWYMLALIYTSIGISLPLHCQDLEALILDPKNHINFFHKTISTKFEPREIMIEMISDLIDDKFLCKFSGTYVKCKIDPFEVTTTKYSLFSIFLSAITLLNCMIGKQPILSADPHRNSNKQNTKRIIALVEDRFYSNPYIYSNSKIQNLKDIVHYDSIHLNYELKISSLCLIENSILYAYFFTASSISEIQEYFNQLLKQIQKQFVKSWPPHPLEVFSRIAAFKAVQTLIKHQSNSLNKVQIINSFTNLILNNFKFAVFIGKHCYHKVLLSVTNSLSAFTFEYFRDEPLKDYLSVEDAFYFHYGQKLVILSLSCLTDVLDIEGEDKSLLITQTVFTLSQPLVQYTNKFKNNDHSKTCKHFVRAIVASQAIAFIGSKFSHISNIFENASSYIHQCFMRPVSLIDRHLVNLMVYLTLNIQNDPVYNSTIDIFRKLVLTFPTDALENLLDFVCTGIITNFRIISNNLRSLKLKLSFMATLLEIFVQLCNYFRRNTTILVNYLPLFLYHIIQSISLIVQRIPKIPNDQLGIQNLFKNFWACIVIIGSSDLGFYSQEMLQFYREISVISPPLTIESLKSEREFDNNMLSQSDINYIRSLLIQCLECSNNSEISNLILRLPPIQIIFLTALYEQESLSVERDTSHFPQIFYYLENTNSGKDKNSMYIILEYTCDNIFDKFIDALLLRNMGYDLDNDLTSHATLLLVKFNSEIKKVQRAADKYLSILMNKFPHMLWNSSLVRTMLDFLHILKVTSDTIYTECTSVTIHVPHTPFDYTLPDTFKRREDMIKDYQSRCDSLIVEATRCAPEVISTILLDYLMQNRLYFKESNHSGIEVLISSIISAYSTSSNEIKNLNNNLDLTQSVIDKNSPQQTRKKSSSNDQLKKKRNAHDAFITKCINTASNRSNYIGKISGILSYQSSSNIDCENFYINYEKELFQKFNVCENMNRSQLVDFIMLVTSYICFTKRFIRKLIFQLCNHCLNNFSLEYIKLISESWQWIFSSFEHRQVSLLSAICLTWESTTSKQIGIFNMNPSPYDYQHCIEQAQVHDHWIQFFIERYQITKFYSAFQVKLIAQTVFESIRYILKSKPDSIYFEINCVPFLRLISLGLKLLQNKFLSNAFRRIEMRDKLFRVILLYFSSDIVSPSPISTKECLSILNTILKSLSAERKLQSKDVSEPVSINIDHKSHYNLAVPSSELSRIADSKSLNSSGMLIFRKSRTLVKFDPASNETMTSHCTQQLSQSLSESKSYTLNFRLQYTGIQELNTIAVILQYLCYREITRLSIWLDPLDKSENIKKLESTSKSMAFDRNYLKNIKILYSIYPKAALMLTKRFPDILSINRDVNSLIKMNPSVLISVSNASEIFWLQGLENPSPPDYIKPLILIWARTSISVALQFMSPQLYSKNIYLTQYAIFCFKTAPIDLILFYIPQLVQCLRHDTWFYLIDYIKWISQKNNLISHQFIWNMQTSTYIDEESSILDPVLGLTLKHIIDTIHTNYSESSKGFYIKEFDFFEKITQISAIIKPYDKPERRKICQLELSKISPQLGVYLPTNPDSLILEIDYNSGIPMQSAAKAPFLARFKVLNCNTEIVEKMNVDNDIKVEQLMENYQYNMKAAIFKVGDDVRQDMLALQVISLFKKSFEKAGLKLYVFPYKVVATSPGCGVIECVPNAKSRDQLGKQTDVSLDVYFAQKFGDESSLNYKKARENFTNSFAAFCLVSYILQVKDRHNGNIMINEDGCIIHIDFGFLLDSSPGGNIGFEPDMKITTEMLNILGRSNESLYFKNFVKQTIKGYLAIRRFETEIINIVALMIESNLPCFRNDTLKRLRYRLGASLSEKDAGQFIEKIIHDSMLNLRTVVYDLIQKAQNEIPY